MMKQRSFAARSAVSAASVLILASTLVAVPAMATDAPPSLIHSEPATSSSAPVYTHGIVLRHSGAANGTVLATFEHDIYTNPMSFPIYKSTDDGTSWTHLTDVQDTAYNRGLRGQPDLFELPQAVGTMPAGTILLAGSVQPLDQSSTTLVLYKSSDHGASWTYLSTIDVGGPAIYDPSPTSTTTTVWEPEIYLDANGDIVVSYSDERQKADDILQALVHRTSYDAGLTWGPVVNDIAVPDLSTRPGMMTVTKLPDGRYFGAYEIVGIPEVPVYGRFSDDGQDWGDPEDIGDLLATSDGSFLFGSPQVIWVDAGGADGTLVVNGQRYVTSTGSTKSMLLTNTSLGNGDWTPVPQPVQITGDILTMAGFSQSMAASLDNTKLIQVTTVNNSVGMHDVVSATMPLNSTRYAAADAALAGGAALVSRSASAAGSDVGYINDAASTVTFSSVTVPTAGTYELRVRYSSGLGAPASHAITVNGGAPIIASYEPTVDWNSFLFETVTVSLNAGANTIIFAHDTGFAELDQIEVHE
ncbi:CBM35 domain-containing protein [Microbacterium sp. A84]|uniref:CBM35 domain-containing protein n=1 Tax=Microbacterium sp. A84 TaxID=3450715 RepID=UPI003F433CDA